MGNDNTSTRIIECPCGTVLRGNSDSEVVAEAQRHAQEVHQMGLDDEQARAMVRPA